MRRVLVNDIETVVSLMRDEVVDGPPYYMYGHMRYISGQLASKDKDVIKKFQKYPLIALKLDVAETLSAGALSYNLNLFIIAKTEINYTVEQRTANVFVPVLYPLYEKFFDKLKASGLFMWPPAKGLNGRPEHVAIDRYYWGKSGPNGNDQFIFNDPLDAIEIQNLKLNSTNKNC